VWPKQVSDLKTKIEAAQALNQFGFNQLKSKDNTTISQLLNAFIESSDNKRKESTLALYRFAVKKFDSVFGDMRVRDITHKEMYAFRDEMIRRHGKVNTKQYLTHLNGLFNWAADPENDFIVRNPIRKSVKFSVRMPQRPAFTDSEIRRVFRRAIER
jgi:integrase